MATIAIKIKNLSQIKRAFAQSPRLMVRELNKAIFKTTTGIHGEEILNVGGTRGINVVSTGLKSAVQRGIRISHLRGELHPNIEYAPYVHEGTRFMRGRPFLLNAVKTKERDTDKYFTEAVNNVLNEIGRAT